jgi:phenylalanine-4-hydroxylase
VERLARCYWYSVEFGMLRERGALKAYGAGLLSSFGELGHAFGDAEPRPELLAWDPAVAAQRPYPITEYQGTYFVAESMHDARRRMRDYCRSLPRPFYARYVPATERIWVDRAVRRQTSA